MTDDRQLAVDMLTAAVKTAEDELRGMLAVPLPVAQALLRALAPTIGRSDDRIETGDVIHAAMLPLFVPEDTRRLTYTVTARIAQRWEHYDQIEAMVDRRLWLKSADVVMHALGWPKP